MTPLAFALAIAPMAWASGPERVRVTVDPRIELAAAIRLQVDDAGRRGSPYEREMVRRFSPWREHEAVALMPAVWQHSVDVADAALLCFSDPPALFPLLPLHECSVRPSAGFTGLERWIEAARDFARVSNFDRFFREHRPVYEQMMRHVETALPEGAVAELEEYFGGRQFSYTVVLSPAARASHGGRLPASEGTFEAVAVLNAVGSAAPLRCATWCITSSATRSSTALWNGGATCTWRASPCSSP